MRESIKKYITFVETLSRLFFCETVIILFMEDLAEKLYLIISDYRNDDGVTITVQDILEWSAQFGEDSEFILTELLHIMPQIYISKSKAILLIQSHIEKMISVYKYQNIETFLMDTEFLDMQEEGKSQKEILKLLDEYLTAKYKLSYTAYTTYPKKNFIYFDDVLATGGTIGGQLLAWLNKADAASVNNYTRVIDGEYKLSVNLFCLHTFGYNIQKYRIKKTIGQDIIERKITWYYNYEIENHLKFSGQSLNIAIPTENQPARAKTFLAGLSATKFEEYAYRKATTPEQEVFFSSPENRIKYENILLMKGLDIIGMIGGEIKPNVRPLGLINPTYKTYGLGTHFFTWRNVPNNSPLVFWWEVPGHNWKPLFKVGGRGRNI